MEKIPRQRQNPWIQITMLVLMLVCAVIQCLCLVPFIRWYVYAKNAPTATRAMATLTTRTRRRVSSPVCEPTAHAALGHFHWRVGHRDRVCQYHWRHGRLDTFTQGYVISFGTIQSSNTTDPRVCVNESGEKLWLLFQIVLVVVLEHVGFCLRYLVLQVDTTPAVLRSSGY
ncbi:hypothetical protein PsorP6_019130 [Peronosclerospora sorghi]|nr:hypothetical protein PsorP6_019130 [Peronosclerospora sorghi]